MKEFINARFLVPPVVTAFFIFLVNPEKVLLYLGNSSPDNKSLILLILTPIIIFSLGILISSIATVIIIILKFKKTINSEYIEKNDISGKCNFLKNDKGEFTNVALEMVTWFAISDIKEEKLEYIRNQIHKRWNAFNANLNYLVGIFLAISVVFLFRIEFLSFGNWYWISWCLWIVSFICVFLVLMFDNHRGVKEIDEIMVKRWLTEPKDERER